MNKLKLATLIAIILLGVLLKLHNYSIYPQRGATSDEYSYTFLGVNLLTKGVPISWSAFTEYKNLRHLTINKLYFPIVYPYFDHTPLNGVVVGGWTLLWGENTFEKIQLKTIRLVPIFLSTISSILVFLLGLRIYNYKTAVWALLIYSTTAIFSIQGRVVLAENLVTPLFLGALYLFLHWQKEMTIKRSILLGVFSGLSFWSKELGVVTFLSLFYLFLSEHIKSKRLVTLSITFLAFIAGYTAYGIHYDAKIFWGILSAQSNRAVGPDTLFYVLSTPIIINKLYYDGWYYLGFVCFFIAFISYKENKYLLVPSGIYFLLLLFSLTEKGEMGWYIIPLFPFMALFTAKFLLEQVQKIGWGIFLLLIFVGMYVIKYVYEANFGLTPVQFRIEMVILFLPFILAIMLKKERVYRLLSHFWFYTFILANIFLTYFYVHPA